MCCWWGPNKKSGPCWGLRSSSVYAIKPSESWFSCALFAPAKNALSEGVGTTVRKQCHPRPRRDAFVFMTQRTPALIDALKTIVTDRPRLRQHFLVTLGPKGIERWGRGRTDVPRMALPWNDIDYAHPGRHTVKTGNIRVAILALRIFRTVDGRQLDLPFPMFGPRGINRAGTHDANKLLTGCCPYTSIA